MYISRKVHLQIIKIQLTMKQTKLYLFTLLILVLTTLSAIAHDFEVDGIYYLKNGTNAIVTFRGANQYSYNNEYFGEISIPSTVTYNGTTYIVSSIGEYAFYSSYDLTSITIPNSVTSIGNNAFAFCNNLLDLDLPNSVSSIGEGAFDGCSSLTSVTIPNSVTSIGKRAFGQCWELASIVVEEGNLVYDSRNDCNAIIATASNTLIAGCKNTAIPYTVTHIGNYAFFGCHGLKSVTIPYSIISIGDNAFCNCGGLTNISIPNSVTSIGNYAFESCYNLTNFTIPNSVTFIGDFVCENCSGLTSLVVENGNDVYDSRDSCNAIIETATNTLLIGCVNTIIPNTVVNIGTNAFYCCQNLTSVNIPYSVKSIGYGAFNGCSGLTSITMHNSVTTIDFLAFSGCIGLDSITIPNSVTTIGNYAFEGCTGLTQITCLATSPPSIRQNTFSKYTAKLMVPAESVEAYLSDWYWSNFSNIIPIDNGIGTFEVDGIYYRDLNGDKAELIANEAVMNNYKGDVVIPETVVYEGTTYEIVVIDGSAFNNCVELSSVVIGDRVTIIEDQAFTGCIGLTSVTIGSGVRGIGSKAFNYCSALQTVTCRGMAPPVMANANCFSNAAYSRATLLVPRQQIEAYQGADYWYKFNTIEGWGSIGLGDVNADGKISITDVTSLINIMLSGNGEYNADADLNYNGRLDIGDVATIIDYLLNE